MALSDKLKDLRGKAEEAVVERKDQITQAVQKAGEVADKRTGGRYHEQIQKAGGKATGLLDTLERDDASREQDADAPSARKTQEPPPG
jgi:hypothetical protein